MSKPTVVLHIDAMGNVEVFADGEVDVIWCSDLAPNDRCYRATPEPIPAGLLDDDIGCQNDGSPAAAKMSKYIKEAYGLPAFEVISGRCSCPECTAAGAEPCKGKAGS